MPRSSHRRSQFLALAILTGALASGSWLIKSGPAAPAQSKPREKYLPATPEQRRAFRVTTQQPDALPYIIALKLKETVPPWFQLNLERGWQVETVKESTAWIVSGPHYICVVDTETVISACNTTENAVKEGMAEAIQNDAAGSSGDTYLLLGMASNRVRRVIVREESGYGFTVRVSHNVFSVLTKTLPHVEKLLGGPSTIATID